MSILQNDNCLVARGTAAIPTAGAAVVGWNTSSNGNQWFSLAAANTCGSTGTALTMTGSTTLSSNTLTQTNYRDGVLQITFTKSNADRVAIIWKAQNTNNYYSCDLTAGNFRIRKFVSGANTNLATVAFTDAGAKTNIKVTSSGFGTQGTNITAKIWLEGSPESGATILTVTDQSLIQSGAVGILVTLGVGTNTASIFSFTFHELDYNRSVFAAPTYNVTNELPTGMTYNVVANQLFAPAVVADMKNFGNGTWARWQQKWLQIEYAPGLYDWSILDDAVYQANTNGIRLLWNVQSPPAWRQNLDGCGQNSTLTSTISIGAVTSIPITALRAGAYIPNGIKFTLSGNGDVFTVNNPGAVYTAGATVITVTGSATITHNIGEALVEQTQGLGLAGAEHWAEFMGRIALRYNGENGLGYIDALQFENENYDTNATRLNAQVTPITPTFDGLTAWENGGAIMASAYQASINAIRQVNGSVMFLPCSVRGTPSYGLNHRLKWMAGFLNNITTQPQFIDYHFYTGGSFTADNTWSPDPLTDKLDITGTINNFPSMLTIQTQFQTLLNAKGWGSTIILMGEFGWDKFDDNTGESKLTNQTYNTGTPTSTIVLTANHTTAWPDGTQLYIDNLGANPEIVYSYGANNSGSSTVNITTDARGKGPNNNAQVSWNPSFNHGSGVNVYAATGVYRIATQAQDLLWTTEIYNNLPKNGKAFYFTDNHSGTAVTTTTPQTSTNTKALFQNISGLGTYMQAFNELVQVGKGLAKH